MLIFRQLFDPQSSTYTYLLGDGESGSGGPDRPGVRAGAARRGADRRAWPHALATLETHVHADHVTGAWLLKQRTGCRIVLAANSGAEGADRYLVQDDVVGVWRSQSAGAPDPAAIPMAA